jgi:2-polyprenyl-3-methyl-5-hydroxy-6-metoxy-1,4-benzoquinol methylase
METDVRERMYNEFSRARVAGKFSRMGSWRLVKPYLENIKVLDIGCADGLYLGELRRDSVGLEQLPALVESGRADGLNIITGDVSAIKSFSEQNFQGVLYSHVMEHVDSPIQTLRDIYTILPARGRLVLGLPIERCIYRDLLRKDYFDGTHIYGFSIRNAKKLLAETGFEHVRTFYHLPRCRGPLGRVALALFNLAPLPFRSYFSMGYWIVARKLEITGP